MAIGPCRDGARGVPGGGTALPKFCLAPQWPPKIFQALSESPTQTIDSSLAAKLAPPVAPQIKMSDSAPGR